MGEVSTTNEPIEIVSVSGFVDHFGGRIEKAAAAFEVDYVQFQSWLKRERFPARRFSHHQTILERHRLTAPKSLWGQV